MKRAKRVKMLVLGIFLFLSGLVAGCGVDVDVDDNDASHHCAYGYNYCSYSGSCRPYNDCCGDCCGKACNNSDVSVDVRGPGVNLDVDVK